MVQITKQFAVAALIIAPALAAPVAQLAEQVEARARRTRAPGARRASLSRGAGVAGQALEHAANAATIAGAVQSFVQRDFDEEMEARALRTRKARTPGSRRASLSRGAGVAGQALEHAANAATVAGTIQSFVQRDFDDELETRARKTRAPGARRARLSRGAGVAGQALDAAANAATIAGTIQSFVQRDFDDELETRARRTRKTRTPGARRASLSRGAGVAGQALDAAANAATIAGTVQSFVQRDFDDELETRARKARTPGARRARLSRGAGLAGQALEHAANAATIAGTVGQFAQRDFDDELEVREPKGKLAGLKRLGRGARRAGRGAGRALDAAGTLSNVVSMFTGRDFDDSEFMYERDIETALDEMD